MDGAVKKQSSVATEGKVAKPRWHKRVYRSASQFSDCLGEYL